MKAVLSFIFLAVFVTLAVAQQIPQSHGDGRPQCNDAYELTRNWRNNWDPNSYWRCVTQGTPATLFRCNAAFIERLQVCGSWAQWFWQTPFDPPNHN